MYIKTSSGWVNNGAFTSITAGIVQETGSDENSVMSQKATTDKLTELMQKSIPNLNNFDGIIDNPTDQNFNINTIFNSGIYTVRYSNGSAENLPTNFPISSVAAHFIDKFIIIQGQGNAFTFTTQIMICDGNRGVYYRWSTGSKTWNVWRRLDYMDTSVILNTVLSNKFYQDKDYIDNPTETTFSIDNQYSQSILRIRYSNGNGDNLPNNYPITDVSNAYIDLFITSFGTGAANHTFAYQLFIADKNRGIYYRWRSASAWNPRVRLDYVPNTVFHVTPDQNLLSVLLQHLTDGATIIVEPGNYDILQMYKGVYGETYFDTYEGYNSGAMSIGMGLPIKNGLKLICSPNAIFTCNYDGSNAKVTEYFSAFNIWDGGEIEGLNLTCSNLRYGIHDDSHVDGKYHLHRVENCYIHSTTKYTIGFGFGPCDKYLYKNNYLQCDGLLNDLYGHNYGGNDSQNFMEFTGNYLAKSVLFQNYGQSTKKSIILVNNNSMKTQYTYAPASDGSQDNLEIVAWNNEIRG